MIPCTWATKQAQTLNANGESHRSLRTAYHVLHSSLRARCSEYDNDWHQLWQQHKSRTYIPLLYICFNMHCIMAATKTTNMAFQLQPPSSVGGSPQGAGGTWVLNWFVWLYFKCRIPPDVYSEGCFYRASFMGTQLLCSCWKTPLNFLYCNKAAKPVTQHNKQFEHLAFLGI